MNSDNQSDEDFIEFCTRIDKQKDLSKKSVIKKKPIRIIRAKEEDDAFQNYNQGFQHDPVTNINTLSKETIPFNLDKEYRQSDNNSQMKRIIDNSSVLLKSKDRNNRIRERLAILKEKAKQDFFNDLRDAHEQYENCDSDELEEITMNLRNDYEDLNTFLEAEYITKDKGRKSGTFVINPSPRRYIKKRLSFSEDTPPPPTNIFKSKNQLLGTQLNMSNFAKECKYQPQGTVKKIKTGIQSEYNSINNKNNTRGSGRKSCGIKFCKTPTGKPSQLKTVAEVDEPTQLPRSRNRSTDLSKYLKCKSHLYSTPKVIPSCSLQTHRDLTISSKKLPRRGKQKLQTVLSTTDSEISQKKIPQKIFQQQKIGMKFKPKFKPITEHNLGMYKKRAHNVYTTKVTQAKRTIPVTQRTSVIDNFKKELDDKLKRIDKLPQLQKELDMKYAEDVRTVTEQLHDWTDGRNEELNSLKRNYEFRTSKLIQDFEIDDFNEMPKARAKMQLKIPKHNLDEYRERAHADNAKRNMPVSERNGFLCNLKKELEKKLQRIDKIPELAKSLETKYYESVKKVEKQFADDDELLQEQLEFLKEEYNAKMGNLDEDSIMPLCVRDTGGVKISLNTNNPFDCKTLYNRIGPVLDLGALPKPSGIVITQKDQILANLKRADKSNKTKKQVLTATSKPQKSQIPPIQTIQETVKIDKHLARKQLMEAARTRAKNLRQKLKEQPSEPLVPKLTPVAAANALRKEGAEDIFHMMLVEHEAIDMSKPPQDILEVLTHSDLPKLEIVGNAFELDDNEIVPIQIPTRDLNQLSHVQEQEISATLQMKQHPAPSDGLAAKLLNDREPIKIPLNKNPDYDPILVPVYLNSYKYEDLFQVRGTTFPKWFPGFYSCGPQEDTPQIILRESPSEILQTAWIGMKPKRVF